jgi:hypothetical protein
MNPLNRIGYVPNKCGCSIRLLELKNRRISYVAGKGKLIQMLVSIIGIIIRHLFSYPLHSNYVNWFRMSF